MDINPNHHRRVRDAIARASIGCKNIVCSHLTDKCDCAREAKAAMKEIEAINKDCASVIPHQGIVH